jgi:hypothetical protein
MSFAVVCIVALVVLGLVAAIASYFEKGNDEITVGHDCSSCTSADDGSCKLHCLMEERRKGEAALLKNNEE